MRKALPSLMLWSGLMGVAIAVCLGLFQWRILWMQNHPPPDGGFMIDWNPYPQFLALALNWWVPFSVVIVCVSIFSHKHTTRRAALILGWCSHALSTIGLMGLGLWVFTGPLGGGSGVWWMDWNK
jgi:hypothetical protein